MTDYSRANQRKSLQANNFETQSPWLEPDDEIVGVTHNDHVARGELGPPLLDPQVEGVVQKHVREQR